MEQTHSLKFIRQRKFYVALPVLVLPFITLLFWALGGGKVEDTQAAESNMGFNFNLPDAYLEDKSPLDKLGFYEQAEKDSLRLAELIKNDPYYQTRDTEDNLVNDSSRLLGLATKRPSFDSNLNASPYSQAADPQEQKVYQKLDQLNAALNASTTLPQTNSEDEFRKPLTEHNATIDRSDMERPEGMMRGMESGTGQQDPELLELNSMLEKIMDIQHPERVQERINQESSENRGRVFAVAKGVQQTPITSLDNQPDISVDNNFGGNGFFSLDDNETESPNANAIEAVIHETQELVNGSTVKLRLVNDVYVNGMLIPADNFLYGIASLDGERLKVQINSFRYRNSLFPVALSVFDMDGLDGIHIPGAISRDAAKQSGDRAIQGIGMTTFDQSLGAQAASAGIELTRNFLSKKVRLVKVTVKAGYQVLLRDQKQAENQ